MLLATSLIISWYGAQSTVPLVLFFSAPGEKIKYDLAYKSASQLSATKSVQVVNNGDCIVKLGSNAFAYFSKTVPSLKEIRARAFLYDIVERNGLAKPIGFSEIEQSEFSEILEPFWWQYSEFGSNGTSKFSIEVSLETTIKVGSSINVVNFGPHQVSPEPLTKSLSQAPLVFKRTPEDAQKFRMEHLISNSGKPYSVWTNLKISHEIEFELVKEANDLFKPYIKDQMNILEAKLDHILEPDSKFAELKSRRGSRSVDELRQISRAGYQNVLSVINSSGPPGNTGSDAARVDIEKGTLSHRYDLHMLCFTEKGRILTFSLTKL